MTIDKPGALTDDARDTTPPDADDAETERVMATMLPADTPPSSRIATADSLLLDLIQRVAAAAEDVRKGREDRERFERTQVDMQEQILAAVQKADNNSQHNYEMLRDSDREQNARLAEGDARFFRIERSIQALKDEFIALITRATIDAADRIGALELGLQELREREASKSTATRT